MSHPDPTPQQPGADAPAPPGEPHTDRPPPVDLVSPQFSIRAVITGTLLTALLSTCNLYVGLMIGWSINMSLFGALATYGVWLAISGGLRVRRMNILETNISQTVCSAGAAVASAGLVAPIPALAMLTGQTLEWPLLSLWVFSVCMVGIVVGIGLRRQMLVVEKLPFATGLVTAETLRELYAKGSESLQRVLLLGAAGVIAAGIKLLEELRLVARYFFPLDFGAFSARSLTFGLDVTPLMYCIGALVGIRACISLLVGAVLAWGVMAPALIRSGHLRLEIHEPLAALPAGVKLPPEPHGYASYDEHQSRLVWKGQMTAAERDALLAQSGDPLFQEGVRKLHVRSQLRLAAPLLALPAGLVLPPTAPVRYEPNRGELVATGGLSPAAFEQLKSASLDAGYQAAVAALFEQFQYATTRYVQHSTPLNAWPEGFRLPRALQGTLRFDAARHVLICKGPLRHAAMESLQTRIESHRVRRPATSPAVEALLGALARLQAAQHNKDDALTRTPIPTALAGRVSYDADRHALIARGILTKADGELLKTLLPPDSPAAIDLGESLSRLVSATQFVPARPDFRSVVNWLLWPGVSLMVISSLVSFAFSWRSIVASFWPSRRGTSRDALAPEPAVPADTGEVSRRVFTVALLVTLAVSVWLQISLFAIAWWAAIIGTLLTFLLAIVAGRVAGETNITPVGAMGKVTQLVFGAMVPADPAANLMAANVTGGAASQCADLLHDLKTGYLLGGSPRAQALAQSIGALAGSMVGAAAYLILIPDPREQLMTDTWPAPAVAVWGAVARLFQVGLAAIPSGASLALLIAGVAGAALAVLEKTVPRRVRLYLPSPASLGLAMVIQAHTSLTMFTGAIVAYLLGRFFKTWSARYLVAACAGAVAGESLTGVGIAVQRVFSA